MQKKYTFKLCVSLLQTKQKHNAHRICKEYIYLLRLRQLEFKTTDRSLLMIIYCYILKNIKRRPSYWRFRYPKIINPDTNRRLRGLQRVYDPTALR